MMIEVLDLLDYPGLVVGYGIVLDGFVRQFLFQPIDDFDLLECDYDSAACAALTRKTITGISFTLSVCKVTWTWYT